MKLASPNLLKTDFGTGNVFGIFQSLNNIFQYVYGRVELAELGYI